MQHVAGFGAQTGHRLVVAHLPLRQRHDRLQIEVDAIGIDSASDHRKLFLLGGGVGLCDRCGDDRLRLGLGFGGRGRHGRRCNGRRCCDCDDVLHHDRRRLDGRCRWRCRCWHRFRRRGFGHRDFAKSLFVGRHRFGELSDQRAQFADLDGERVDDCARAMLRRIHTAFDRREAPADFIHLARQLEIAARQIAELTADHGADAQPARNGAVKPQGRQDRERDGDRLRPGEAEAQIDRGSSRSRDHHHADCDEDGSEAHDRSKDRCKPKQGVAAVICPIQLNLYEPSGRRKRSPPPGTGLQRGAEPAAAGAGSGRGRMKA